LQVILYNRSTIAFSFLQGELDFVEGTILFQKNGTELLFLVLHTFFKVILDVLGGVFEFTNSTT
jgi:hypothetical protein